MSHYAKVINNIVEEVIVAEQDFITTLPDSEHWIQTSYNTHGGQHPEGRPLRKNFAGIGFSYDPVKDAFIPPKPFDSWLLNNETCLWEAPVSPPLNANNYYWDEATRSWVVVTGE
jgi:hypothetical protein